MAYEELASQSWRNLPPAQWNTGLLNQGQVPAPTNYYQQIMQQMSAQPGNVTAMPQSAGGYKPGIFDARTPEMLADELARLNAKPMTGSGGRSAAEQQRINEFFDAMTPAELAAFQAKNANFINQMLTPLPLALADLAAKKLGYKGFLSYTLGDGLLGGEKTGVVTVGEGEAVADGEGITAPGLTITADSGLLGLQGVGTGLSAGFGAPGATSGNAGALGTGPAGMAAGTTSTAAPGATAASLGLHGAGGGVGGGGGGSSGGVASGSGGGAAAMGTGAGGMAAGSGSSSSSGSAGGGGAGGGGGCCFIMLEARYGDGTMDAVVRRYRDEKMTDKNRRGYYKLAEVFVPLMRESRIFKFLVAKTFADPLVSYGKYHYGENKHGWLFKPVEKFWMKVFNTLGSDTKFIRENGETV